MIDDKTTTNLLKNLVEDLVHARYEKIEKDGRGGRLSPKEIKEAVEGYPGKLTMPSEESFSLFHKYEYAKGKNTNKDECLIEYELWYDHQESDLTLSAIVSCENHKTHIKIEDIHVL